MSQRDIVSKTDLAVSNLRDNGGYLNPEQAGAFIRMVQDEPTVLKEARAVPMNSPKMEINKLGFGSRILKPAPAGGTALAAADRSAVTPSKLTLQTSELIAEVQIPYDVLEDSIERGGIEATIMQQISARAAIDLEEWFLKADTASSDPYLALQDGIMKRVSSNVYDATSTPISKAVFKGAVKAMPPKYFRNPNDFRFYCSFSNEFDYRDTLADRQGANGDFLVEGVRNVGAYGVPVRPAAMFSGTLANNGLLTIPQNLIWGVQRQISIETDRDIRARAIIIVMTLRAAIGIEEETACVKIINIG